MRYKVAYSLILVLLSVKLFGQTQSINQLLWLEGEWMNENNSLQESWQYDAAKMELSGGDYPVINDNGHTRKLNADARLRIFTQNNTIYYSFQIGPEEVFFKLTSSNNNSFVFENPDYVFPQRIIYEKKGNEVLVITSSGINKNTNKKVESQFKFSRVVSK